MPSSPRIILPCLLALNALFWTGITRADVDEAPPDQADQAAPTPADNAAPATAPAPEPAPAPAPEQTPAAQAPSASPDSDDGALPAIEAQTYHLRPIKISKGRKSYVFEKLPDPDGETQAAPEPAPDSSSGDQPRKKGKILLLRQEGENIMALRVLQEDPDNHQLYARRVQKYGDHDELALGSNYLGLEKIMDLAPPSEAQDKQDKKDLKELGAPKQPDAPPENPPEKPKGEAKPDEDVPLGASVDEIGRHNPHRQWLSAGYALVRNIPNFNGGLLAFGGTYYSSGGARYGFNIKDHLWMNQGSREDSLSLEGSLYYYQILSLDTAGDSYTVMPIEATMRYNIFLDENLGVFFYGGFLYNKLLASNQSSTTTATYNTRLYNLSRLLPAAGAGLLFRIGPEWYTRVDAGIDVFGIGLVVRF